MTKIKNTYSISKNTDGEYAVLHMTFCNGLTVNHRLYTGLATRADAHKLIAQLKCI